MKSKLTLKQRAFCLAYAGEANGNATEAARIAGYKGDDATLSVTGFRMLRKANIEAAIGELRRDAEKKASGKILSATETLVGLTRIALADIAEVFEPDGSFDLQKAKARNVSRLIKSISFDKDTGRMTKIELHNAHGAHVDLGKYHGLFPTKIVITPEDADRLADEAAKRYGLPLPETFGGEPLAKSEM
ncbi:MAG TPA: terminase small subunit [Pyrinomonadaceae bacterium]|nr:terminase small subunit [Pyrinomonadaceae bacterium]